MEENKNVKVRRPPLRFGPTQKIVGKLLSRLDGTFVAYWNNPRGAVCHNDVIAIYEVLEKIGQRDKVYVFLKSEGGNGQASLRIVSLLRKYFRQVHALVPLECASAATMIALGANTIHMGPMAYLTAIDTSLTHDLSPLDRDNDRVSVSLDELKRVVRLWQQEKDNELSNPYKTLFKYVHPLVVGAVDRADSLSMMLCKEILSYHMQDEAAICRIAETLNCRYPSHSYPILIEEARRIGLQVTEMDHQVFDALLDLNGVYSEMGQKCTTDFDELHSHTNEVLNIIETEGVSMYYQMDRDWFYRAEERRWVPMNDVSGWRKAQTVNGKLVQSRFHIV
jgi:hypothetical protein